MGEMPDLAESQTSLMQGAKSHPSYCLKFIDTRSTQHQPRSSLPVSIPGALGNGGPHTPSIPLTHSRPDTWARSLFALPRLMSKRQDRHPADGDRRSPPQAVFNSVADPTTRPSSGQCHPTFPGKGGGTSVVASLAGMSHKCFGENAQILRSRVQSGPAGLQDRVSRALLRGLGPQLELGMEPRPGGAPGGW